MGKLKIALLFGGKSAEHEISIMSARSVLAAVNDDKYDFVPVAINKEGYWFTPEASRDIIENNSYRQVPSDKTGQLSVSLIPFLKEEFDLVFPLLHGPHGEDGKIQGFLELIDIPYVGSGVLGSAAGMDKVFMKQIFSFYNLPQGDYIFLTRSQFTDRDIKDISIDIDNAVSYPCFVKPANMGSSIGITKIENESGLKKAAAEALKYDKKVIFEEAIEGREIECSVLGNEEAIASIPGEIKFTNEFYDYRAKYQDQSTDLVIPARLSEKIVKDIQNVAIKAFKAIDGRGFARVDFFLKNNNQIVINEINTIPGFTRYSMYPKLWEASGIEYPQLIDKLIQFAFKDR